MAVTLSNGHMMTKFIYIWEEYLQMNTIVLVFIVLYSTVRKKFNFFTAA